jgi:alpha-L-rhamnosidase
MCDSARYIWYEKQGEGRNLYGRFRKTFTITGKVESAALKLFADTYYQLFVNGAWIEFGPVRFDPNYPLYDTHDISPYLRKGENVIAVLVNCFGCKTYKAVRNLAGLIAWGSIRQKDGQEIDLCTREGSWKCRRAQEYARYAPKQSFALNPAELYDQSFEESGWKEPGFDEAEWLASVEIADQDAWGELSPRRIPYMRKEVIPLEGKIEVFPLLVNETRYSFSVALPHFFEEEGEEYSNFIAFSTWLYSPEDQAVRVKVFWGEGWLNGKELPRGEESMDKSMCILQSWDLKKGWNYYFGKVEAYFDILDQYIAIPSGKGIIVSANKDMDTAYFFRRSPVISKKAYERYLKPRALPYGFDERLDEIGGWIYSSKQEAAQNPCRETGWDDYGDAGEIVTDKELSGHCFPIRDYPDGFSLFLDLTYMHLFHVSLSMEGVKDAVIDLTYTEHLNRDGVHFRHTHHYSLGDRILCSRNTLDWSSVHPRGARYVKVTVRNAAEDVVFKSLTFRTAGYPIERKGYFRCSDPCLNEIWLMGERTQAANMEDAYVDCQGRERGMYLRDMIIQYHNNLVTFGDQTLMQRCLELFGQSPDPSGKFRAVYPNTGDYTIADFALEVAEGYLAYYNHTGDKERIRRDWHAIRRNLDWFNKLADERADLLLDSEWHLSRHVNVHYGGFHGDLGIVSGFMDNTGIHCVFSCIYLMALRSAKALAELLGETEDVENLQRRIHILEKSMPEVFWNEKLGCFSDNIERTSHSAHASLFAVRAGVVSEEQLKSVREHIKNILKSIFVNGYDPTDGVLVSPAFAFYLFDGLYKAGLPGIAQRLMKDGWGWMLAQGLGTCSEYFNLEGSLCHAWSASPTYYLSTYILGVHYPKGASGDEVEIGVMAEDIDYAEGVVPHRKGLIEVKWHREGNQRIFDYVKAPKGVKVRNTDAD